MIAVVLAGGPPDAVSALAPDVPNKAFVPIAGVPLVQRTIAALRSSPHVGRIIIVAPRNPAARRALTATAAAAADDADDADGGDNGIGNGNGNGNGIGIGIGIGNGNGNGNEIRDAGDTMTESLQSGLRDLPPDELVLVFASDLPVLSRAALEDFIARVRAHDADLVYACVERATHTARFPDVPHTWARLADGTYCGGGGIALRPRVLPRLARLLGRLGRARKNPLRLAAIFGPAVLVRYALGRLTVAAAERRASVLLGAPVRAAICAYPEIAINVDRPSDVPLAESLVARPSTSSG